VAVLQRCLFFNFSFNFVENVYENCASTIVCIVCNIIWYIGVIDDFCQELPRKH